MNFEAFASLLEISLFYGLVLAVCIWQIVKMRRMIAKDRAKKQQSESNATIARCVKKY